MILAVLTACALLSGVPDRVAQSSTSGKPAPTWTIADLTLLAAGTEDLVGRLVYLPNVRVLRLATTHGFFLDAQAGAVYVMPDPGVIATVAPRDVVTIHGVVANMPPLIRGEINPPAGWNPHIYVAASVISK